MNIKEKHPFKLTAFNIAYSTILLLITLFVRLKQGDSSSYELTFNITYSLTQILFPLLIAYVVWYAKGKKYKGGTTTFNVLLTIMLLSSINRYTSERERKKVFLNQMKSVQKQYLDYKKNNPYEFDSSYSAYSKHIEQGFKGLANSSYGEEKKAYKLLLNFHLAKDSLVIRWNKSFKAIQSESFLSFSSLYNLKNYNERYEKLILHINNTKKYKKFINNRITYIEHELEANTSNKELYKNILDIVMKKDSIEGPIMNNYITAHINYGYSLIELFKFLENKSWAITEDQLEFYDNETLDQFNIHLNKCKSYENEINSYFDQAMSIF